MFLRSELRVKIKSLAAEARIIRAEEHRHHRQANKLLKKTEVNVRAVNLEPPRDNQKVVFITKTGPSAYRHQLRASVLQLHRIQDVRSEQRAALLAYAFLRGRQYRQTEQRSVKGFPFDRVLSIIKKFYGSNRPPEDLEAQLKSWAVQEGTSFLYEKGKLQQPLVAA